MDFGQLYRGIDLTTTPTGSLHDSFTPADDVSTGGVSIGSSGVLSVGQSWASGSSPSAVTGVLVRLRRVGTAGGLLRAAIYAHSGTFGTSSVPTGNPLVFSPWYAADSLSTSPTNYWFPLSGWTPTASTNYVAVLEAVDHIATSGAHQILYIYDDGAAATHGGNVSQFQEPATWSAVSTDDLGFAVYYTTVAASGTGDEIPLRSNYHRLHFGVR